MGDRFVARSSPFRIVLLLLIGLGLVLLGAWIAGAFGPAPRPGMEWIGWIGIAFFGLCVLVAARRLVDRGDEIVIDRRGLYLRRWSDATIPWADIRSIECRAMSGQWFAGVHLHDPARHQRKGLGGRIGILNKGIGFGDIALSTIGTDRRFDELVAALDRFGAGFGSGDGAVPMEHATKM